MSKEEEIARFVAFCIEQYKRRHGGDGKSAYDLFAEGGVLDFLTRHFDVEHCLDPEQIVDDIDQIIACRRQEATR